VAFACVLSEIRAEVTRKEVRNPRMTSMSRVDFSPAPHTDAMQLGDRSDAPAATTNGRSILLCPRYP